VKNEQWIFCGYDPVRYERVVPKAEFAEGHELLIRFKERRNHFSDSLMMQHYNITDGKWKRVQFEKSREKQRSLREILEKVYQWRRLYHGFRNEQG
jgi:hypothetical protein